MSQQPLAQEPRLTHSPRHSGEGRNPVTDYLDLWSSVYVKKSASGRGSNGKISAYGIQKLRKLILELAVRGKLVLQDTDDEPASVLLKIITEEKTRLVKHGIIKKQKALPEVSGEETQFELPECWEWARLGNLTNYGVADKVAPGDVEDETWVLELEDVEKGTSRLLKKVRHLERQFRSAKNRISRDDVIYGKLRPYLDKVLVANEDGVCTTEMIPFRGYAKITPYYIRIVMKSPYFIRYANESTHGMNLPRLGTDKARLAIFPLAPENEQHRIVAKVDELMALCDQLEQQQTDSLTAHQTLVETLLGALTRAEDDKAFTETWQLIAEHFDTLFTTEHSIDQLKQAILQLAVMGKLVPQDHNDEPASALLEIIAREKAQLVKEGKIKKQKSLPDIAENEKLVEIPLGWKWARFDYLALHSEAGWSPKCDSFPREGDNWGVLKVSAVTWGKYNPNENKSLPENLEPRPEYEVKSGDFLISRANTAELVARSVVVSDNAPTHLMMSDKIIRFVFSSNVYHQYLSLVNSSQTAREYYALVAGGTSSSMKNVSREQIRNLIIALPPLAEQHRIVAKVDELMALCDALKAGLQDSQTTQTQLADAIVEQAVA